CVAMVGPIRACGATPVFYRLQRDLSIDLEHVDTLLSSRTRCILTVHFFGFPADLRGVRERCDARTIALIEDSAHAFYGGAAQEPIGRMGDFAIGSLMKFFPLSDGGCLVSFRRALAPPGMRPGGVLFQVKSLLNILERAGQWSQSMLLKGALAALAGLQRVARRSNAQLAAKMTGQSPGAASGGIDFESAWVHTRMSAPSRSILGLANHRRAIERRRRFYQQLGAALENAPGGRSLYPQLPEGVVPYVFPFVLAQPHSSFVELWKAGVPMYRWEDVARDHCPTARDYEQSLVQFPCHQELTDEQAEWLALTIRAVLERCAGTEPQSA
ncbi:MAG TPA: DegT/DnrJ/EryC1/StrS family aminotransferase, partial [Povalibacter sp.]|nr:DegT/DnrJ/EryC1/StrS family aminotransferase [Povalibacter sp.]